MWGEGIGWRLLWRFAVAPLPKLAEAEIHTPNLAMTDSETVLYTADMLLELRNMTSLHPKLRFLTYLLEMAFQEAFTQQAQIGGKSAISRKGSFLIIE